MKKDMELIRTILLKIEEKYNGTGLEGEELEIEDYDYNAIAYHCDILNQAGLVKSYNAQYADNKVSYFGVGGLTWSGNEYLDKIRDNSIWGKVKDKIKEKGLPFAIDVIKDVATSVIAGMM